MEKLSAAGDAGSTGAQREELTFFILVMRFVFGNTHQIDTVVGRFDNLEVQRSDVNNIARQWQLPFLLNQQTRQRGVVLCRVDQFMEIEQLLQRMQIGPALN